MKQSLSFFLIVITMAFSTCVFSKDDPLESGVMTITSKTVLGSLSIANGRYCLVENEQGHPVLLSCDMAEDSKAEQAVIHYIILQSGQCLVDSGSDNPELNQCDYQNREQQWLAIEGADITEFRNVASRKCLTSAGINNRVTMASCNGTPAQNWTLPQ
ncbi:RICIN domain-containing protein [Serratia marcescens]|uniref:RICIN domain-containing protein n=1 Tax=Serratia marcescens TaxID=615 RepID=UPI0014615C01|nr:RICIN domain-containing protein [Serratia marcescens]MBH2706752.1 ricin-type beta-trefoil lectin domain protein [Serratia marcescens]MBH3191435.1 ricin-type beta-trefoil lectin domain protein [Serratia marcescens]MBN5254068.1 ricin-type beta-trefoil lectin domain protein [Serratia marcescens]NMQ39732.1 ricin-type beta-trefoil lectin domain protein [Serratia marcescens]